ANSGLHQLELSLVLVVRLQSPEYVRLRLDEDSFPAIPLDETNEWILHNSIERADLNKKSCGMGLQIVRQDQIQRCRQFRVRRLEEGRGLSLDHVTVLNQKSSERFQHNRRRRFLESSQHSNDPPN